MVERRKIRKDDNDRLSFTRDSFNNFAASLGYGASNLSSGSTYGFNPITRNHTLLEWMYRGSWLVKQVVDSVADDMTREQITIESDMPPDDMDKLTTYMEQKVIWQRLNETIKWSRLYGGCIAAIMIDGQRPETPLNLNSIGPGQFKGLLVLDRWMLWPHLEEPVKELGPDFGYPMYYEVVTDAKATPHMKLHYSRCIVLRGLDLPYWQRIAENMWGLSVIEPLFDRLIAFDSTTQGAAQLVYRAHLRTLKIEKLRELIAFGGEGYQAVLKQINMIRLMQSNESLTVLDSTDEYETHSYAFGGLSDVMVQFAQQLSGAAGIPLVRLFGQSPAGLNATGDADIRNYYDNINSQQESRLRLAVQKILDICHRSVFGRPLPDGFHFSFVPLWQMTDAEKAEIAVNTTNAVTKAVEDGVISPTIAMKELRQSSHITGVYTNITDEDIEEAELAPPPIPGMAPGGPGEGAQKPLGGPGTPEPSNENKAPGEPAGPGKEEEAEDMDYRSMLPPFNKGHVARMYAHMRDDMPMMDIHGIPVTIETQKGERRQGPGWSVTMPSAYGYINGTSSPEGTQEQLDCFIGPDEESSVVWMIEQRNPDTGAFDEFKIMLCYPDRDTALDAYRTSFDDGRADERIGLVKRMSINGLKSFITEWTYGKPKFVNGGAEE